MKTRIIQTKFWADGYISTLTTQEKLLFMYFLTNDRVNIIHCYECPDQYILLETGVSRGVLERCKQKLERDGKIKFFKGYIRLVNADKYESYRGADNEKAKEKSIQELSLDVLDWYNNKKDTPVEGVLTGTVHQVDSTINHKSEIINHNKGVVKGENLLLEDLEEIAVQYQVPIAFVQSKYDDMLNWCKAKGKRYKDYKAALRNWVKTDALKIRREATYGSRKVSIDTIPS
jgi:hypothetical protein